MPLLGGVRPPIAALLCALLAVAVFPTLALGTVHDQEVPQAVRVAERRIAEDAAASVRAAIDAGARAVRRSAASATLADGSTPAAALRALAPTGPAVLGGALLDPHTGRPLATSGAAVPPAGVDAAALMRPGTADPAPRLVSSGGAGPRLLLFARVTVPHARHELLLVVAEKLPAPVVYGGGRTGQLVDGDGKVLATTGAAGAAQAPAPDTDDRTRPAAVVRTADAGRSAGDTSGSVLGDEHDGLRRVAGWASVAAANGKDNRNDDGEGGGKDGGQDDSSRLGLTMLTFREVASAKGGAGHMPFALAAAGALVVITVLVTLVLWGTVQRPLLRLHLSAARLAEGVCDISAARGERAAARGELARPVPVAAFGEPGRVGRALESIRRQLVGGAGTEPVPPVRCRLGVRSVLVVCALVIAGWAMPLLFLFNRVPAAQAVPATSVADQQARTAAAADRVRQSLDRTRADLAAVASALSGAPPERAEEILRRERADHPAYRSLYVLNRAGGIVLRTGKRPLRALAQAPAGEGLTQVSTSGRNPTIAAHARIPAAGHAEGGAAPVAVVAEIGVSALNDVVARPGLGRVWVTDERHRVLTANIDFRGFQPLPTRGLTRLVARTEAAPGGAGGPASAVLDAASAPGEGPSVAAAAPLARTGPVAALGWRVVSAEAAADLELTGYQLQARTMLAGLLALSLGVAGLIWLHIVVARPLRALTRCAERLAGGDRRTVLYPVHHDECGSVTRNLELLRQALVERDRGAGSDVAPTSALSSQRRSAPWQQRTD
ncbi:MULTISPECIES: HAMP domain-containing protein [unclassified Streptomyces]|uniref:HAMP domain-containing protein n=1 Tax=unclassified Streptomyces TaxID=2593676 RepID=UPI00036EC631|nr:MULTISPECIES: HAMP domain-containing protein [unclassified Streptomyces]MYT33154.1 HAMP domain-containing protein [Streptomyces sp. SID8354]